jgi:hypothetical protein
MKKILMSCVMLCTVFLLTISSAHADLFTFTDDVANWPGTSPITVTGDTIGSPTTSGMDVITEGRSLSQVIIYINNRKATDKQPDALFINSNCTGADDWQSWDYYVKDINADNTGASLYDVASDYVYSTVPLTMLGMRDGHVNGIKSGLSNEIDASVVYEDGKLIYTFEKGQIVFEESFVIGYTPWCANDVILTPPTSVPEPTQMLLLGTALIGLAGIGRKKFFKK